MQLSDWLRLSVLALVWGSAFFLIEIALQDNGPLTIVGVRLTLAAITLVLYCALSGIRIELSRRRLAAFAFMGLLATAVPFSLITLGQTMITSSLAAILIATTPLFTVLIAHLWARAEPATPSRVAGVTIGFCGVVVLMGLGSPGSFGGSLQGQACLLGAAICYAVSAVFGRRFRNIPPVAAAAGMLVFASLYILPAAFILETPFDPMPRAVTIICMLSLALLSTALAYKLYFTILANSGATNAMLVTIVQPPLAILLGVLFLNETLDASQLSGLALILTGLMLVDGRVVRLAFGK